MSKIGDILLKIRTEKGYNKSQFSRLLGISSQLYGMYERGEVDPKTDFRIKLRDIFNVSITIDDEEDEKKFSKSEKDIRLPGQHKTDRDKYIELLERDRALLEQMQEIIKLNLAELLIAQRLNRAQLTVLTDLSAKTLATVQKRNLDQVREETSKSLNDVYARQLQTDTAVGT